MKIWRGLRTRIVFGSILCGLLGLVVSWAMIRRTMREAIQSGFAPSVYRTLDHGELDRCQRDPAHWTTRIGRGARLDAYDESKSAYGSTRIVLLFIVKYRPGQRNWALRVMR